VRAEGIALIMPTGLGGSRRCHWRTASASPRENREHHIIARREAAGTKPERAIDRIRARGHQETGHAAEHQDANIRTGQHEHHDKTGLHQGVPGVIPARAAISGAAVPPQT
jgi:hypothetical protein